MARAGREFDELRRARPIGPAPDRADGHTEVSARTTVESLHDPAQAVSLQRSVGNAAVAARLAENRALPGGNTLVQREAAAIPANQAEGYRAGLTTMKQRVTDITPKFSGFVDKGAAFILDYRNRAASINETYTKAYETFLPKATKVGQWAKAKAVIADGVLEIAGALSGGGLLAKTVAETLEISEKMAEIAIEATKATAKAVSELQKISAEKEGVSENAPDFKKLPALEKLDQLNSAVLPLAAQGTKLASVLIEVDALLDALPAGGRPTLASDEFKTRFDKVETATEILDDVEKQIDPIAKSFDDLHDLLGRATTPDVTRCEQDLWIHWCAEQKPGEGILGSILGGPLADTDNTKYLKDLGVISPGARGLTDPHEFGEEELKKSAQGQLSDVAAYWAGVWLSDDK